MSAQTRRELSETIPPVVLVVDDEPNVVSAMTRVLRREEYDVLTATSADEALVVLERLLTEGQAVAAVVSDYYMPGMHGIGLLCRVRERSPLTVPIILSGQADAEIIKAAIDQGYVFRFFAKPWDSTELRLALREAVAWYCSLANAPSAFANGSGSVRKSGQ